MFLERIIFAFFFKMISYMYDIHFYTFFYLLFFTLHKNISTYDLFERNLLSKEYSFYTEIESTFWLYFLFTLIIIFFFSLFVRILFSWTGQAPAKTCMKCIASLTFHGGRKFTQQFYLISIAVKTSLHNVLH